MKLPNMQKLMPRWTSYASKQSLSTRIGSHRTESLHKGVRPADTPKQHQLLQLPVALHSLTVKTLWLKAS